MLATICLHDHPLGWSVDEVIIECDGVPTITLGRFHQRYPYERAIQEAKELALLKIRHRGGLETEHDVDWHVQPTSDSERAPTLGRS